MLFVWYEKVTLSLFKLTKSKESRKSKEKRENRKLQKKIKKKGKKKRRSICSCRSEDRGWFRVSWETIGCSWVPGT